MPVILKRTALKQGFNVVDIPIGVGAAVHQLYVKAHSEKDASSGSSGAGAANASSSSSSTLFIGNVDLRMGMDHIDIDSYLREMLQKFGEIDTIAISDTRNIALAEDDVGLLEGSNTTSTRSRFAHVKFQEKNGMNDFLKAVKRGNMEYITESIGKKWGGTMAKQINKSAESIAKSFSFGITTKKLQKMKSDVNSFMEDFEEEEVREKMRLIQASKEVDEDGFQMVKSRNKRKKSNDNGENSKKKRKKNKKKTGKFGYRGYRGGLYLCTVFVLCFRQL